MQQPIPLRPDYAAARRCAAAAARQRRARERRRRGLVVFHVEADENGVADMLIRTGRLNETQASSRRLIERELKRLIRQLL